MNRYAIVVIEIARIGFISGMVMHDLEELREKQSHHADDVDQQQKKNNASGTFHLNARHGSLSSHDVVVTDDTQHMVLGIGHRDHPVMVLGENLNNIFANVVSLGRDHRRNHQFGQWPLVGREHQFAQIHHPQQNPLGT